MPLWLVLPGFPSEGVSLHCDVLLFLVVHVFQARVVFRVGEVDGGCETSECEEIIHGFGVPSQGCSPEPVLVGVVHPILKKSNVRSNQKIETRLVAARVLDIHYFCP